MSPQKRLALIRSVQGGNSVKEVCRRAGISRKSFYKWKKRLKTDSHERASLSSLQNLPQGGSRILRVGKRYRGELSREIILEVLECAGRSPHLSALKISQNLKNKLGHLAPGPHGVQNVLKRHNLNTISSRLIYQKTLPSIDKSVLSESANQTQVVITPRLDSIQMQEMSTPPPIVMNSGFSHKQLLKLQNTTSDSIATNKYDGIVKIFIFLASFLSGIFIFQLIIAIVQSSNPIGTIFAAISIIFGTFFFLYSFKYYLSIAIVLIFSRTQQMKSSSERRGLETDLTNIILNRQPFISIHLPLFNEKKVVNRLLQAVTSMEYDAFEVIVLDDSTDETKQIVEEWRNHPKVKIIHRDSRSGFKGGALHEAISVMNSSAEFVLVFDADFLPYPDTLTQFIKYFKSLGVLGSEHEELNSSSPIAAIQGYQWHVLNKSENWITRGVRSEYSGSYVIERSSAEIYQGLKQIAGSVFMIRADVIRQPTYSWGKSITEDFELTLKLYRDGWKVVYTPYIQSPSECVSTLKRLVRQRMRWAEGHSFNIRKYFRQLMFGFWTEQSADSINQNQLSDAKIAQKTWIKSRLSFLEKLEFLYLAPYYLQSFFFLVGTFSWFLSESVFGVSLPFWTSVWGWSLVFTNLLSLPLMNVVGLFLEESEEKDFAGVASFVLLTYFLAPFQAYAALKGFLENEEGTWFRTPKTGKITDVYRRSRFYKWFSRVFPASITSLQPRVSVSSSRFSFKSGKRFDNHKIGNYVFRGTLVLVLLISSFSRYIPTTEEVEATDRIFLPIMNTKPQATVSDPNEIFEIQNPHRIQIGSNENPLEYIFHREPRLRIKIGGKEIDIEVTAINGKRIDKPKVSLRQDKRYIYENLYEGVDLEYSLSGSNLSEQFILEKYEAIDSIHYDLRLIDLEPMLRENEVYFASADGGSPIFYFTKPFLYEKEHPEEKSFGIVYKLEKSSTGYILSKEMTDEGRLWLQDPKRNFPVVIDPSIVTSIIEDNTVTTANANYGGKQRKLVYADTASGGAAWYAVYQYSSDIFFEKCKITSGCNENSDWTNSTNIGGSDSDNVGPPSLWWEADRDKIWVVWADDSEDNAEFVDIDVTSNDPGTVGTICDGQDQRDHVPSTWLTTIAVAADDDIFITYNDTNGTSDNAIWKVPSGVCDGDTTAWTTISTGSGVTAADFPVVVTMGNEAHIVFSDGNLSHSVTKDDGGTLWDTANTTISTNTSKTFSVATDGVDLWVIVDQSTTGADLWTCSNCTSSVSWSDSNDPWTGQSNDINEVSIGYSSSTNQLVAFAVRNDTNETMITKGTDADSISWGNEYTVSDFGVSGAGLSSLSSVMISSTDDGIAASIYDSDNTDFEFATVPENLWVMIVMLPIMQIVLKKHKKRMIRSYALITD